MWLVKFLTIKYAGDPNLIQFETTDSKLDLQYAQPFVYKYIERTDYNLVFEIILISVFIILLVVYWNRKLEKEVREKKDAQNKLKYINKEIQNYLDIAQVLIMALDNNKNVIMINQKGADILGYTKEEIIGKNWVETFLPKNIKTDVNQVGDSILENKGSYDEYENCVLNKSGEERLVLWKNALLLDEEGNTIGILTSGEDITLKKEQQKQLLAQSRMAQMGEMISMIAHQWRQPLGAISSTAIDLNMQIEFENFDLEKERGRKECQSYFTNGLGEIDGFVQNLTNTIDDFRNFYQPNKESSSVYFIEPISKALNIIKASFLSDGIEIVQTCVTCDKKVKIHSNELMQVILNILKNSQDNFKEQGTKNPKIIITCKCSIEDKIILEICDNGGGISEDILPKIFDPYFSTKGELNGTGLGLYMSKIIIEEHHNGSLEAINLDDGVCFKIIMNKEL